MKMIRNILFCAGLLFWTILTGCEDEDPVVPVSMRTSVVTQITETSAEVSGKIEVRGNQPLNEVGFCLSGNANPTITDRKFVANSTDEEFTVQIDGLRSGKLYFVRSYSIQDEIVVYGDQRSFTTLGQLAYKLPFEERFLGTSFPPMYWGVIDGDGDGFLWNAYNSRFKGAISDSYNVDTDGPLYPENYLVSPKIELQGSNPVLKWSVGVTSKNYPEEHYKVVVSETRFTAENILSNGTIVFEETMEMASATTLLYRSASLKPFEGKDVYVAWVHYDCSYNDAMYVTDIRLEADNLVIPKELPTLGIEPAEDVASTSVFLTAALTSDGGASITSKGFVWSTTPNPTNSSNMVAIRPDRAFEATVKDLVPGTVYYVRAFATNEKGTSYSEEISFTTPTFIVTQLLKETFGIEIPAGWYNLDKDGDGEIWFFSSSRKAAFSESYYNVALFPENYLFSPEISIPADAQSVELTYEVAARSTNYYAETYKVVLLTATPTLDNCRNSATIREFETLDKSYQSATYKSIKVDLSSYKGQKVYLGFLHGNSTDQDAILLRNVEVKSYK